MKKLITGLISITIACAGAELFLRWDQARKLPIETRSCRRASPYIHHELVPDTICRSRYQEWDTIFSVNSLGFRSPEISIKKKNGIFRVLLLGDSFTESESVNLDQTAAQIVQRDLKRELNMPVEIVNMGTMSYSPILYKQKLKQWAEQLNPDLVIINVDMSDFQNDYSYTQDLDEQGSFKNLLFQQKMGQPHILLPKINTGIKFWLRMHSVLYATVADRTKQLIRKMRGIPEPTVFQINDPKSDVHYVTRSEANARDPLMWNDFGKNMNEIHQYLKSLKIPWVATIYPYGHQISPDEWGVGRTRNGFQKGVIYPTTVADLFVKFGEGHGFRVVNMVPAFQEAEAHRIGFLYWPYDGHFSLLGQQVFAHELEGVIRGYAPHHRP